jgi:hypothetical protein
MRQCAKLDPRRITRNYCEHSPRPYGNERVRELYVLLLENFLLGDRSKSFHLSRQENSKNLRLHFLAGMIVGLIYSSIVFYVYMCVSAYLFISKIALN